MRALAYDGFREPVTVIELPVPEAPSGGVVVEVLAAGLCRSDWHAWAGHDPDVARFPHVPGHEFAGRIAALGEGVRGFTVGQPVTAPFVQACGVCDQCRAGDAQVCPNQTQPGFDAPGAFAEYVVVRSAATNLVVLPEGLAPALAAGLGCRVATAFRAVVARARVRAGERVAVIGCGGVGLAAVAVARAAGAIVLAVDPSEAARTRALELGAAEVYEGQHEFGVEVSLDCLGSPATARASILALGRRGRHVQVGLLPPAAGRAEIPMERVIAWELDILGSHGMAASDYPELLAWAADGRLPLEALLAPQPPIGLETAATALPMLGERSWPGIVIIDPTR